MSDLDNTPGLTWSHPGGPGEGDGMVWYGCEPATAEDIVEIREFLNRPTAEIDHMSLVGRYDREWNSAGYASVDQQNPNGGEGSNTYETQLTGLGAQFSKEDIWYYTDLSKKEMLKGIPPEAGAYWKQDMGDGYYDNIAGAKPFSHAARYRGDGQFYWDEDNAWYDAK